MRFIHLADLHIGKKVNEFSMLEDQRYVLEQVLQVAEDRRIDGVILAGDIYDKAVPAAEAVSLLDWFLTELADMEKPVYMVSGNHDNGERLAFGANLLKKSKVYVSALYDGSLKPIQLEDEYGTLNLYLLPFIKPIHVKRALEKEEIETYQQAVEAVFEAADIDSDKRNLLVAHQLVTGASRCESEDISVGGLDNIDALVFKDFDYVALGHIHGPQRMTRDTIRYAGTILKYSFSECDHHKSITIVDMKEKGNIEIEEVPVMPLHDLRVIVGTYEELISEKFYKNGDREDYLRVILTDEEEIPNVLGKLREIYPNIMKLEYNNTRTRQYISVMDREVEKGKMPQEYFSEFFELQNNRSMTEEQEKYINDLIEEIWG